MADARRVIPSVERLLSSPEFEPILAREPRARVAALLRQVQQSARSAGAAPPAEAAWYAGRVATLLDEAAQLSFQPVINATGVVLHTNLGRAPLCAAALDAVMATAAGYSNLEYDLTAGKRGSRYDHCTQLLCDLSGAEAALVVNNNAAALVLVLNALAANRSVVISRGELVEIGDSFRIAEICERSGARLHEIGATNRTHLRDYAAALENAAAILKVHRSNFQTSGFVAEVAVADLVAVAREKNLPLVHDLGSGLLESLADLGLPDEPTAADAVRAGADIVTMSGDKLLGGPQAGIILGRAELITAMRRNPLCRALRVDKLTIAALEATLRVYLRGTARADIPVLRMITEPAASVAARAAALAHDLERAGVRCSLRDGASGIGGGAFPGAELPTTLLVLDSESAAADVEAKLRSGSPPVVARIAENRVLIDVRTVLSGQEPLLVQAIADAV